MNCLNVRCLDQGYCSCHHERTAEAAGGCGGILILIFAGVFAAFLCPAVKIFRSNIEYDDIDSPKFAGTKWLLVSPVFGFLSQMLFQLIFVVAGAALISGHNQTAGSIFKTGLFTIYFLAMGLAVVAFSIKNREAIKLFAIEHKTRNFRKLISLVGLLVITVLAIFALMGALFSTAEGYFAVRSGIQNKAEKDRQLIIDEKSKFDLYAGQYKMTTRSDKVLFLVSKSKNEAGLRLNVDEGNTAGTNNPGCLLTPGLEGNSIYYSVSECLVNNKPSPLLKVYFYGERSKVKMTFVYDKSITGDTLEKIK